MPAVAMLLTGGVAAGPSPGRWSTPPGSSGRPVPVPPRTGPAAAEPLGHLHRTRPGGTLGAVLQTRGAPCRRWPTPPAEALVASLARLGRYAGPTRRTAPEGL